MASTPIFDFGVPYNIFTGLWTCIATSYSPKGDFLEATACNVAIYWAEPYKRMHFRQTDSVDVHHVGAALGLPKPASRLLSFEFDLEIEGKSAKGGATGLVNVGAETTPDCYIFQITAGDYVWYNNQYCGSANERRVIGPQLYNSDVQFMLSQHLMRVSYDVPDNFKRALVSP
jgi:hypothetical protein